MRGSPRGQSLPVSQGCTSVEAFPEERSQVVGAPVEQGKPAGVACFKGVVPLGSRTHRWPGLLVRGSQGAGLAGEQRLPGAGLGLGRGSPTVGLLGAGLACGRDPRGRDCALTCGDCSALPATAAWPSGSSGAAPPSWGRAWGCRRTRHCPRRPWP